MKSSPRIMNLGRDHGIFTQKYDPGSRDHGISTQNCYSGSRAPAGNLCRSHPLAGRKEKRERGESSPGIPRWVHGEGGSEPGGSRTSEAPTLPAAANTFARASAIAATNAVASSVSRRTFISVCVRVSPCLRRRLRQDLGMFPPSIGCSRSSSCPPRGRPSALALPPPVLPEIGPRPSLLGPSSRSATLLGPRSSVPIGPRFPCGTPRSSFGPPPRVLPVPLVPPCQGGTRVGSRTSEAVH